LALAPVGGFAYYNRTHLFGSTQPAQASQETELSEYFKQYVKDHNLVTPHVYKKFQENYIFNHFFEKGVLKNLEGLDMYNLFLNKHYHDNLASNNDSLSHEQKQQLHGQAKLHCTFSANDKLESHAGHVHGGFTSTLFDNVAGCLAFMASDFAPAVTAYLNVSHEKPLNIGAEYVAIVEVAKVEGRKVLIKGKIVDKENNVYTNMESLFIQPKWGNLYLGKIYRHFLKGSNSPMTEKEAVENLLPQTSVSLPWNMCN